MTRLVHGAGLNDANYKVTTYISGRQFMCPFYDRWKSMLERCYSLKFQLKNPSYAGCAVCEEWLIFSNFKAWMMTQDWEGKELDKDLLVKGNKLYSAATCIFIGKEINQFTNERRSARGEYPLGVCFNNWHNKMVAYCRNPFNKTQENLGYFDSAEQAHEVWRRRKHELACQLADLQDDNRVAAALRLRYHPTTVQRTESE